MADVGGAAWGIATFAELRAAGLTEAKILWRLRTGALLEEYPGVYRVGHRAPSTEATYMAAVKACGEGALLAGRAAAHLWGLIKGPAQPPEVISLTERRIPGIVTHRARRQPGADGAKHRGIPVTTVARTLVDLAAVLPADALGRACHEAGVLHGTTPKSVREVIGRRPGSRGVGKLRRIISGEEKVVLSRLEERFVQRLEAAELPLPVTNRVAGGRRVDCRWPERRLTVELDSYTYHSSRHAWERDRRREREAYARGDQFRRYTWEDVFEHPGAMMRELTALLIASSGW